jgi:ferredoxin-thioredoxin reductase catalytic subunit
MNNNMKIVLNPNEEYVQEVKRKLKDNDGFCPCKIVKTTETKCMCKEFRDMIERGETGECSCGLYVVEKRKD